MCAAGAKELNALFRTGPGYPPSLKRPDRVPTGDGVPIYALQQLSAEADIPYQRHLAQGESEAVSAAHHETVKWLSQCSKMVGAVRGGG